MKKHDKRFDDTRITESTGNVFVDLGFDEAEAAVMLLRTQVMAQIGERVRKRKWTQVQAARELGISQPRVNALMKGAWKDFSLDMLLTLAARAGLHANLRLHAAKTLKAA